MAVGVAVDSGKRQEKQTMCAALRAVGVQAVNIGLWVNGRPFDAMVADIVANLERRSNGKE